MKAQERAEPEELGENGKRISQSQEASSPLLSTGAAPQLSPNEQMLVYILLLTKISFLVLTFESSFFLILPNTHLSTCEEITLLWLQVLLFFFSMLVASLPN